MTVMSERVGWLIEKELCVRVSWLGIAAVAARPPQPFSSTVLYVSGDASFGIANR
jgi:hypothetical protein